MPTSSWDHWRQGKKPRRETVYLSADDEKIGDDYNLLRTAARDARKLADMATRNQADLNLDAEKVAKLIADAKRAEDDLQAWIEGALDAGWIKPFVVKTIGRGPWEALQLAHPPPEKGSEKWEAAVDKLRRQGLVEEGDKEPTLYNDPDTYPPAVLAACADEPALTIEEATELWEGELFNAGEWMELLIACQKVNTISRTVTMPAAPSRTPSTGT